MVTEEEYEALKEKYKVVVKALAVFVYSEGLSLEEVREDANKVYDEVGCIGDN